MHSGALIQGFSAASLRAVKTQEKDASSGVPFEGTMWIYTSKMQLLLQFCYDLI